MFNRYKVKFLSGILGVAMSSLVTTPALSESSEAKYGGRLKLLTHTSIISLNPAINSGLVTAMPGVQLFAGLVEYGSDWNPKPYLAKNWEISDDNLTYTFDLVENAVFHDKTPITSEDVAFSLETVKKYHPFGQSMFGTVKNVETPTPNQVVIKLTEPTPALMLSLSPFLMPVLPKHIYGKGDIRTHENNNKPIGSGPFQFKEYKQGQYLTLKKFDGFFREGLPYLDEIVFAQISDPPAQVLAINQGNLDLIGFAPLGLHDLKRLENNKKLVVTQDGHEAIGPLYWLEFNVRKRPFDDVRVRQAIAYAIDKEFIRDKLQFGLTYEANSPIAMHSPFHNNDLNNYEVNIEKANKLLDEAGYPVQDNGIRFSVKLDWLPATRSYYQAPAEYLKPQLKKVGIDVQLNPSADFPSWAKRISNWDFDMGVTAAYNYGDPVIGVERTYISDNIRKGVVFSNTSGYSNNKVDDLLKKARVESDIEKRKDLYYEFQKIINEDVPVTFLFEAPINTVYNKKIKNIPLGIWGVLNPMDTVYIDE